MPVLFLGHGSPMNAIEDNDFHRSWTGTRQDSCANPRPSCASRRTGKPGASIVTGSERPETIHDFNGFPRALFDVRYPAPGSPELAHRVIELLDTVRVHSDPNRGLDHGAWGVLRPMFPEADIPVVQLSLSVLQPGAWHYDLAKLLAPLRDEGVLIVGSGNIVHNLRFFKFNDPTPLRLGAALRRGRGRAHRHRPSRRPAWLRNPRNGCIARDPDAGALPAPALHPGPAARRRCR